MTYGWTKPGDDERREYIGRDCRLNGQPARVVHMGDGWPGVALLSGKGGVIPYSWMAIYNTFANRDGNFTD